MSSVRCSDCGAEISARAAVCPQCGFPLRQHVAAQAGIGLRGRAPDGYGAGIVTGLAATVLVLMLGILAAIYVPRLRTAAKQAEEAEGEGLLKQAHALQDAYWARHAAYASTFEQLKSVGWKEPARPRYYTIEIGSTEAADFCLHALPRPGARVRSIRMRSVGYLEYGARCGGYAGDSASMEADARRLLWNIHWGVVAWRREHKRLPATDAELAEAYPAVTTDRLFVVGVTPSSNGGICMHIAPRTRPPSAVAFSMDGGGNVHAGDGCAGTPIH